MSELNVGDKVILDGRETAVKDKWAQGQFFKFNFEDGRFLHCDLKPFFDSGRLKKLEVGLPKSDIEIPMPKVEDYKKKTKFDWGDRK